MTCGPGVRMHGVNVYVGDDENSQVYYENIVRVCWRLLCEWKETEERVTQVPFLGTCSVLRCSRIVRNTTFSNVWQQWATHKKRSFSFVCFCFQFSGILLRFGRPFPLQRHSHTTANSAEFRADAERFSVCRTCNVYNVFFVLFWRIHYIMTTIHSAFDVITTVYNHHMWVLIARCFFGGDRRSSTR